ncbi:uncharacterized protein M421DRAFT_5561 [Didymella exigua CBS 183.55]|uniref:Uncharacterized protein n=1 Tax=Didymella exigua CBS 183.55 TaxID=1150837 RepID=A0A6A5RNH6_9PLEO|nr:uncharacterized protein M421DRAFT_5561 [Didymella exigua CBS 183.55]KAF1927886.1 hypothetical protein M421DRAFT_5561 [Didymella exigua CBS 183.55]
MTFSSPSLRSLSPFSTQVCDERPEQHNVNNDNRRRFNGNMATQSNSSRLLLSSNHIATQMREPLCPYEPEDTTQRAPARWHMGVSGSPRPPTPPPTHLPPLRRRSAPPTPFPPTDTRRHGMMLAPPLDTDEDLPSYSARDMALRRHTHPMAASELRLEPPCDGLVAAAADPPPAYAAADPCLFPGAAGRRPSRVARALLCPFVPAGGLLEGAAGWADRWAAGVWGRARDVPRRIEDKRARRKVRWLEERGWGGDGSGREQAAGRVRCSEDAGRVRCSEDAGRVRCSEDAGVCYEHSA